MRPEVAKIFEIGRDRMTASPRDFKTPIFVSKKAYVAFGCHLQSLQRVRKIRWDECQDAFDRFAWHEIKVIMRHSQLMIYGFVLEIKA